MWAFERCWGKLKNLMGSRVHPAANAIPGGKVLAHFGLVEGFYQMQRPGAAVREAQRAAGEAEQSVYTDAVVRIQFFDTTQELTPILNCPTVKRQFWCNPEGNLWMCNAIVPTHITLAPCLHDPNRTKWQVLHHRDFDFMRKEYPVGAALVCG